MAGEIHLILQIGADGVLVSCRGVIGNRRAGGSRGRLRQVMTGVVLTPSQANGQASDEEQYDNAGLFGHNHLLLP
jgi:hypothetical protein